MRKIILGLFFSLIFLSGALAGVISVTLHVGETVNVNGMRVTLVDVSTDGKAALEINGSNYVLGFGGSVEIGNLTVIVGNVFPEKRQARLFFSGEDVKVSWEKSPVTLSSRIRTVLLSPGEEIEIALELRNPGRDAYIPLSVKVPQGWEGWLKLREISVLGVYLRHGESAELNLDLRAGEKPGNYTIEVTAGESTLKIKTIVTGKPFKAYVDFPGKEGIAGGNVSFTLHLYSKVPIDVPLKAEAPRGWKVRFLALNNPVRAVRVSGERTVDVIVSVPSNASVGAHSVEIHAGEETLNLLVYITETHAGENGTLSVRVVDEESGNYVGRAGVLLFGNGVNESAVTLPDGTVVLKAPEGTYRLVVSKEAYKRVEMTVKLKAGERKSVTVNLKKLPYYFDITVPAPSKSQVLGSNFLYEVVLENLGREGDTYSLSLSVPQNWGGMVVESPNSRTGISSTYVESGQEKKLYVILIPPDSAGLGNYTANLTVKSLGSDVEKRVTLRAILMGSYGITLSINRYSVKVKSGDSAELRVRVYNTGTSPLTNVRLKIETPKGWSADVSPNRIASLRKDGIATFTVRISVPGDVDAGDYYVSVKAVSDQKETGEQVRVTVIKSEGTTYAGLAMVLLAVLLLVFIFRRYGRR